MLKNKTRMFLLFSLVLITMIGMTAISAADVDNSTSDVQISDASSQVGDTISDYASDNSNKLIEKTGNTKTVKNDGESGTLSDLESDINSAETSITLSKDYTSTDSEQPFVISKDITIDGNGKTITAVNGALNISSGNTVNIKNLIFTGKNGAPAMIRVEGTLNLENVTFTDCLSNTYANPAVIDVIANAKLYMNQCSIDNTCSTTAPIRIYGNTEVNITNSNISNVIAKNSIIHVNGNGAVVTIDGCILANAKDSNYAGAIYQNYVNSILTVNNCIIENNTASYRGGAVYTKGNTTFTNNIVRNNTLTASAYNRPNGVWVDSINAVLTVSNNTFINNTCGYDEAWYFNNGKMNSTVKITVADYTFEENDTVVLVALVTDEDGNKIGDRVGKITFTVGDKTYTASIENGTAYAIASDLPVDNQYHVTASYNTTPEDKLIVTDGVIIYGNVLPPMTDYTSMQEVINDQEAGSKFNLNNNITRADAETKVVIDKDLIINGKDLVIDAAQGSVFEITNGATVTISDLTIKNMESENPINVTNGNLVLNNVNLLDSTVKTSYPKEGLISLLPGSSLVMNNSLVENITGAVINQNASSVFVDNTVFNAIVKGSSNALVYVRDNFTFINSRFDNSQAYTAIFYSAAGLPAFSNTGTLTVENSSFSNNNITTGNSVITMGNTTNINNCSFIANNATNPNSYCSALNIAGEGAVMTVTNSVFINNTAAGDYVLAFSGANAVLNMTNNIILTRDEDLNEENKTLFNYGSDTKLIINGNYWGINENPVDKLFVTEMEEYDDYEDEFVTYTYDVTCDNWIVQETTVTEDPEDNTVFNVETQFKLNTGDALTQNMPEGLTVSYAATVGSFDNEEVAVSENKANNVYYAGMTDSTLTITMPNQVFETNITAPVIDPKNYKGLEKLIKATENGGTLELTKDCIRGTNDNNITIENKTIVIDGKGFTIDENEGRFLLINNANVTLKNMIIKNAGTAYNPSVLQIWTGNLVLENVTIENSTSSTSGGALVYISADSTATINNVTFDANTARFISNAGTTLINNSVIKNTNISTSAMEGWAYNNGPLTIENTVFDSNTGYSNSITTGTASTESMTLNNVTFSNNNVISAGLTGSIINSQGPLDITDSRFENNIATSTSTINGLLYVKGQTNVDNSVFINNKVDSSSTYSSASVIGVFYLNAPGKALNITKSTFINNTGAKKGNVIYNYYGKFNVSNSVFIDNGDDTYKVALHNYDGASVADNNWWGTNDSPRDFVYEQGSSYKITTDTWVVMNATASDVADGKTTITTTLNKVTDASGTISDLEGSLPDGLEVTYNVTTGTLADSTALENGVSTATVQTVDDQYAVNVTQAYESIELSNIEVVGDIIVTEDSYATYFNDDGTAKDLIKDGSVVYISGQLANKTFVFNVPVNVTTYNETQANLTNAKFVFNKQASGSNMTSLIINNTDYSEVAVFVNEAKSMNITNNTITQTNNDGTTIAIAFNQTTNTTIEANTITVSGKSYPITSTELLSRTAAIQGYNSSSNFILDNDITMVGLGNGASASAQDTMIGIEVRGEYYMDWTTYDMGDDESNENMVSDNRITVSGDVKYNYGVRFGNNVDGTIVNNNTINVTGTVYACGVEVGKSDASQVLYNNITAVADNFTYGVYLSTNDMGAVTYATVFANYINLTAKDNYGIELYGPDTTTVSENVIFATGDYSLGIAGYNSDENTITDNNITVVGNSSQTKQNTADKITQDIVGITLLAYSSASDSSITNNIVNVTDLAGSDAYAVTIKGSDNTVTDNTLIGTNLLGDQAVNASSDNTVEDNGPIGDLTITNDTYSKYFDEDGVFKVAKQLDGSSVFLSGEFTDKNFVFNVPVNLTTAESQAILNNSVITFNTNAVGSNISNIIINNKDYSDYVIYLDHVDDVTINNVTVNQENVERNVTHAIGILYGENITIKDSKISTIGKCLNVEYDSNYKSTVLTSSIYSLATKALVIDSNTITTNQTGTAETYGTIEGLDLRGNTLDDKEDVFEDARIVNNVINTETTVYTYGLVFNDMAQNCVVDNNTFNSYSQYYSNGIEAFNTSLVNITNNVINANSAEFAYGIFLSGMFDWVTYDTHQTDYNLVANNTIVCNSSVAYVIELYMSPHNTFEYNNLTANANYSIGIAASDSGYSTVSNNNIVLNNAMIQTTTPSYDSIDAYPAGVKFVVGSMAQPGYNTVTFNNITINADTDSQLYTVNLTTTKNNTVTDNTLLGRNVVGSGSVLAEGTGNTIERNTPKAVVLSMDDITGFISQETTISASVVDEDGANVQDGTVTFKDAKGKVLGTADVVDGVASITATFTKANVTTITAEYANEYTTSNAESTLTIRKAQTVITIDEFNVTVGEEVTITAHVVDEAGNAVTNGKVIFKVNGKTLKDANGKVIYVKVTDGVANITYTPEANWTDANISVVYSGSSKYEEAKLTDVAMNMTEITPALTIEPINGTVTIGTTVTLKATVTGTPTPLNTGKVVFKLNGKTLKDSNGKVMYIKVVNNEATLDYTFTDLKSTTYTLSAVLISSGYDKLEDSVNVTFVE